MKLNLTLCKTTIKFFTVVHHDHLYRTHHVAEVKEGQKNKKGCNTGVKQ